MRICEISADHVVRNPRLHREADALADAGYDVTVVAVAATRDLAEADRAFCRQRGWRLQHVHIERVNGSRVRWLKTGVRQKLAVRAWRAGVRSSRITAHAYARTCSETIGAVLGARPDLVVAHTQPMLAPACRAATRLGCPWGFDFEDILSEEYGEGIEDRRHQALVQHVEREYIRRADFVTTASPLYATWLERNCGIRNPEVVLNVPSAVEGPAALPPGYPGERDFLSLQWVSQTIGPLKGIEELLAALARVRSPVRLFVRGTPLPGYEDTLQRTVGDLGLADRVVFQPLAPPDAVVRLASQHDIGLATTTGCCLNGVLSFPNKVFSYFAAGLATIASDTEGQRAALALAPGAGFTYPSGDAAALAALIDRLAGQPELLRSCRERAHAAWRSHLNWECEKQKVLAWVESTLARGPLTETDRVCM